MSSSKKISKLVTTSAEREFQKLLRRIEKRKVRVPQILEQLKKCKNLKERQKLEEELRILMRKSERDNELLSFYMGLHGDGNLSTDEEETLEKKNKKLTEIKIELETDKTCQRESGYSSTSDVESGNESNKRLIHLEEQKDSFTLTETRETKQSSKINNYLIDSAEFIQTKLDYIKRQSCRPALSLPSNNDQFIETPEIISKYENLAIEAPRIPIFSPIEVTTGDIVDYRDEELDDDEDFFHRGLISRRRVPVRQSEYYNLNNGTSYGHSVPLGDNTESTTTSTNNQPVNNQTSNQRTNNQTIENNYNTVPDDSSQVSGESGQNYNLRSNVITSLDTPQEMRIVYIDEDDLGENYRDVYDVEYDSVTRENYILDLTQNVKYIIRARTPSPLLDLNNNLMMNDGSDNNNNNNNTNVDNNYIDNNYIDMDFVSYYISEDDLRGVDFGDNVEMIEDPNTGETVLFNRTDPNRQWVVLPRDWRLTEDSTYIDEDEFDLSSFDVYIDPIANRRYIIDEKSGNRYFVIGSADLNKDFGKNWLNVDQSLPDLNEGDYQDLSTIEPSTVTAQPVVNANIEQLYSKVEKKTDKTNSLVYDYMTEDDLKKIDLGPGRLDLDENTGETVLINPGNENLRWIILPNDWQTSESTPYVDEKEIDLVQWNLINDPVTKRQYVLDEQTGQRYYVISPRFDLDQFLAQWLRLSIIHAEKSGNFKIKFIYNYRDRLLISTCFSHACTSLVYVVHALKKYALISKRLRYKDGINGVILLI